MANLKGKKVKALFTGYFPDDSAMEGGFNDCRGRKLDPDEATCAAPKSIDYGTKVQFFCKSVPKINNQVFTVTDTGGAINIVDGVYHFDILCHNEAEANKIGRRNGTAIISNKKGKPQKYNESSSGKSGLEEFIEEAQSHNSKNGHSWVQSKTSIGSGAWCAATQCAIAKACGFDGKICPGDQYAAASFGKAVVTKYGGTYLKGPAMGKPETPKPGDFVMLSDGAHANTFETGTKYRAWHIAFVYKVEGEYIHCIEGNWSNTYWNGKEQSVKRNWKNTSDNVGWFARPDWSKVGGDESGSEEGSGLEVHPEKLYSSDNYVYSPIIVRQESLVSILSNYFKKAFEYFSYKAVVSIANIPNTVEGLKEKIYDVGEFFEEETWDILDFYEEGFTNIKDFFTGKAKSTGNKKSGKKKLSNKSVNYGATKVVSDLVLKYTDVQAYLNSKSPKYEYRIKKSVEGNKLPLLDKFVEAPFVELKIGDTVLGTYQKDVFPNYIESLNVVKTNNTIHTYNVQLIHQISPGDNPNYIDQLLSSVGYNTIQIKYGDGSNSTYFKDETVLITDVTQTFDFINCNIKYGITATSLIGKTASTKKSWKAAKSKPSTLIYYLLNDPDVIKMFPGMSNKTEVANKKLIPTDDAVVNIGAMNKTTPLAYLHRLVSLMRSETDSSSIYMLQLTGEGTNNAGFKIKKISKSGTNFSDLIYDVDINYPENGDIFSFSIDSNYSWALSYDSSYTPEMYDYEIDDTGRVVKQNIKSYYEDPDDKIAQESLWTQLTEYPINATLITRGLLTESLLMQYIRINNYSYGMKRSTSGLYIVLGQQDILKNDGFRTSLTLMRVAGDDEFIDIDARRPT